MCATSVLFSDWSHFQSRDVEPSTETEEKVVEQTEVVEVSHKLVPHNVLAPEAGLYRCWSCADDLRYAVAPSTILLPHEGSSGGRTPENFRAPGLPLASAADTQMVGLRNSALTEDHFSSGSTQYYVAHLDR
ncbi:hypothetical protein ANO11243_029040 [Dothideomycetidae sp. 11243]|nr:hypothetical protein ANO11243_029040 [fungal sp. No.11243]